MHRSILGLDIGGANLKAAHTNGSAQLQPFELWKTPGDLSAALGDLIELMPKCDLLAVTMTGELCDCFETKRQGVRSILESVRRAAGNTPIRVWSTSGLFREVEEAERDFLKTAAANWLALASYVGRFTSQGSAVLIDIGSTTTDIVPLRDGRPIPQGRTDPERLECRELVYTGVQRTPVCALLGAGGAAEFFATTRDVYLLLGEFSPDPNDRHTADGRPATLETARARLARMMLADSETCSPQVILNLAQEVFRRQCSLLRHALAHVAAHLPKPLQAVVISGSGEFLARQLVRDVKVISLAEKLGPALSSTACAYAVARLAQEVFAR
jgi:probable H4MPT-linked C1 transfer pathway protein